MQPLPSALLVGGVHQRKPLEEQHREDTRHQVQQQPTQERQTDGAEQGNVRGFGRGCGRFAGARGRCGNYSRNDWRSELIGFGVRELDQAVESFGQARRILGANNPDADAVRKQVDGLIGGILDDPTVEGVELSVLFGRPGLERDSDLLVAANRADAHPGRQRLRQLSHCFTQRSNQRRLSHRPGNGIEIQSEMSFARQALAGADQPVDVRVEMHLTGLRPRRGGDREGEGDLVFVAEVHQRAERQALGSRELQRPGGDAFGQRPVDLGRLAGVTGVDPVNMPVLFDGDDQPSLHAAANGNLRGQRGEFDGEVRGFERARAAVADFDDLRVGARGG